MRHARVQARASLLAFVNASNILHYAVIRYISRLDLGSIPPGFYVSWLYPSATSCARHCQGDGARRVGLPQ